MKPLFFRCFEAWDFRHGFEIGSLGRGIFNFLAKIRKRKLLTSYIASDIVVISKRTHHNSRGSLMKITVIEENKNTGKVQAFASEIHDNGLEVMYCLKNHGNTGNWINEILWLREDEEGDKEESFMGGRELDYQGFDLEEALVSFKSDIANYRS